MKLLRKQVLAEYLVYPLSGAILVIIAHASTHISLAKPIGQASPMEVLEAAGVEPAGLAAGAAGYIAILVIVIRMKEVRGEFN